MPRDDLRTLGVFLHLSLDGYYCDARGDMSFAHKSPDDGEWQEFVVGNASGRGMLLFGRTTYEDDVLLVAQPDGRAGHAPTGHPEIHEGQAS